jgi:hypothetical protein
LALTRCLDCNATLKPDEVKCYSCGTRVEGRGGSNFGAGFAMFLSILFFTSAMLTVASLFIETAPSFTKCLMVTVVLLVVRSSAAQMASKKS